MQCLVLANGNEIFRPDSFRRLPRKIFQPFIYLKSVRPMSLYSNIREYFIYQNQFHNSNTNVTYPEAKWTVEGFFPNFLHQTLQDKCVGPSKERLHHIMSKGCMHCRSTWVYEPGRGDSYRFGLLKERYLMQTR